MFRLLSLLTILALGLPAVAQAPAGAVDFARAYLAMIAPANDDPDAAARVCLEAVARHRTQEYAGQLAALVQSSRTELQRPAELLPLVDELLLADDLHGTVLSQLRWLKYRLLWASGRFGDAARSDPMQGLPRSFSCVGPFGGDESWFAGVPFAPELLPWTDGAHFDAADGHRQLRVVELGIGRSTVDPVDPTRGGAGCYYVLHRVEAAAETQCYVSLWGRGSLELFVNGVHVASLDPSTGDGRTTHVVPVALAKGQNHVLVKTCTRDQAEFELQYVDARWRPVAGLTEVPAAAPIATAPAAIETGIPVYVDAVTQLQSAMRSADGDDRLALQITAGLIADQLALRSEPLALVADLQPADPVQQLAAAALWRRQDLVPEEMRNAKARALEEAAEKQLGDDHWAMLRAAVGLLEEQDQREQALRRLWRAVDERRGGPGTFRLLLAVAQRARFGQERQRVLDRWRLELPNDPMPLIELAAGWQRDGAVARAAAAGAEAIRMRPDLGGNLGRAYRPVIDMADIATAQEMCRQVMPDELFGERDRLVPILWDLSVLRGEADPARWLSATARLVADPAASGERLRDVGDALMTRGFDEQAAEAYQLAISRDPDDVQARRSLCRLRGEPEPGADIGRFRRDGDAAIAAFSKGEREDAAPATTLIDQRIVELFADGSKLVEVHQLRRLNDPSGVENYGDANEPAAAGELMVLRTIDAAGNQFVPVKIKDSYAMPRLEPGVFVEWRYRNHLPAPDDGTLAVEDFAFRSFAENLLTSELVVIRPKVAALQLRARNFTGAPEVIELGDGREALRYLVTDSPRLLPEGAMPALTAMAPVVGGGRDRSANASLRRFAHDLADMTRPTPPIEQQVVDLLAGVTEPAAQLRALHDFCHREIAAARSRSATETLMRKQGQRQQLLFAMLRTAGFTLEPARCESIREELITGDGALFSDAERFFDDACVRVQKDGLEPTWLFFDVARYYPPGRIPPARSGGAAIVQTAAGVEVTVLPTSDEHVQHVEIAATGTLSESRLEIDAIISMGGEDGFRAAEHFLQQAKNARQQWARQFAQSLFADWQVQKAEVSTLVAGEPIAVRATLRRRALQTDGDRALLAMPLPSSRLLSAFGARPDRNTPMRLTNDLHLGWNLRLELDGVQLVAVPAAAALVHGPLRYLQEVRQGGRALVLRRDVTMGGGEIPVSMLGDWVAVLQQVERVEGSSLEFRVQ